MTAGTRHLFKTALTDSQGQFRITGIAPGAYGVFGWQDVDTGAWFDGRFLDLFRSQALLIRFAEGEKRSATVVCYSY